MPDEVAPCPSGHRSSWLAVFVCLLGIVVAQEASAQESPGDLRWGGDAAGGAPFIYGPPDRQIGFEVELADYLGKKLGRKPRFVNGDWDALPDALQRGNLDIVLNGYEYLPDREKQFPSTIPYFVYTLRLIVRKNDDSVRTWDDLVARPGQPRKRVGVLRATVAERYLRARFGEKIEVVPTREVDETFQMVQGGQRLDATVQDSPAATYFVESGKLGDLRVVGEPASPGYYVILTRKADAEFREKLNEALRAALRSGELERIYRKYDLWSPEQSKLVELAARPWPPALEEVPVQPPSKVSLKDLRGALVRATLTTIALATSAMPLAILLGILIAVGRIYGSWWLRIPLAFAVEVLRGTPLLLQMYVLFYLLPQAASWFEWQPLIALTTLPPFVVGVAGLALNYSAYESEIYRAGLLAIPRGQLEAALALGMTRGTALRRIILPQAVRLVIPPVTNDFIALFKDTSICSVILITDLTGLYYQNKYDRGIALQLALVIGILYFALSYPLSWLASRLERAQQGVHA